MVSNVHNDKEQSNPFSTGGGGTIYETHVQATFTVFMLAGIHAPCFNDSIIIKIKLQGKYEGFNTDDLILYTQDKEDVYRNLYAQIKHTIAITKTDAIFGEVINSFWLDYNDSKFQKNQDVVALIIGKLSGSDAKNVGTILEWARYSENETEFMKKMNTSKFSSDKKREKLDAIVFHLQASNGNIPLSNFEVWQFLKHFRLMLYDIDNIEGLSAASLKGIISLSSSEDVKYLWERIVSYVQEANKNAGTINLTTIPDDLKGLFQNAASSAVGEDIKRLQEYGKFIVNSISSKIGGVQIDRNQYTEQLLEETKNSKIVIITGKRGCGKSSILKEFFSHINADCPFLCLRAEDLNFSNLYAVFSAINIESKLTDILAYFSASQQKYLFLESSEKILELEHTTAFLDLLKLISKQPGWTVVITVREYAYQQLIFNSLAPLRIPYSTIYVDDFDDLEISELVKRTGILEPFVKNGNLKSLMRIPFYLDLAYRTLIDGGHIDENSTEPQFRQAVWSTVIRKDMQRKNGFPLKRRDAFISISVCRAKSMQYMIPTNDYDPEILYKLEEDGLVNINASKTEVSVAHDVLEDWALEQYIEDMYNQNKGSIDVFLESIGQKPALCRAFRLWLHRSITIHMDFNSFVMEIIRIAKQPWRDEAIIAVLTGEYSDFFLEKLKEDLISDNHDLLKRFCLLLRIACKMPNDALFKELTSSGGNGNLDSHALLIALIPYGDAWSSMIKFIYTHRDAIGDAMLAHSVALLSDWSTVINVREPVPELARTVGLLALHLLEPLKDKYNEKDHKKKLISIILKCSPAIRLEFEQMVETDVLSAASRRRHSYTNGLCSMIFNDLDSTWLTIDNPDLVIRLARNEWLLKESDENIWNYSHQPGVDACFGLNEHSSDRGFFPASGYKGPFRTLLNRHPRKALDFILELMNTAAESYVYSRLDFVLDGHEETRFVAKIDCLEEIIAEVTLLDGTVVRQYCTSRLWSGYRGHSVIPYLLQCALMALENCLIEIAEYKDGKKILGWFFDYILRNSNSVLTTAVLASVATGFPDVVGKSALPIVGTAEFYHLDIRRQQDERGGHSMNWFAINRDPLGEWYAEERQAAATRKWRKDNLESICVRMQFGETREDILNIIDTFRHKYGNKDTWRFRLHRIDTREFTIEPDEENDRVIMVSGEVEPDLLEKSKEAQERSNLLHRFLRLQLWADKKLEDSNNAQEYFKTCQDALSEAKSLIELLSSENKPEYLLEMGQMYAEGIIKAAVVCFQDYYTEMHDDDIDWCAAIILGQLESLTDVSNTHFSASHLNDSGTAACIAVLPAFLNPDLIEVAEDEAAQVIKQMIMQNLTHISENIRENTAKGIRRFLWGYDPDFAHKCFTAAVLFAQKLKAMEYTQITDPDIYTARRDANEFLKAYEAEIEAFRCSLLSAEHICDFTNIDFHIYDAKQLYIAFSMLSSEPDDEHVVFIKNMLTQVFKAEKEHDSSKRHEEDIDFSLRMEYSKLFAKIICISGSGLIESFREILRSAAKDAPEFTKHLLIILDYETEKSSSKPLYWEIWGIIAEPMIEIAKSTSKNNQRHELRSAHDGLLRSMLYTDTPWQKFDYENQTIHWGKNQLLSFFSEACENRFVFEALAALMYHFPQIFTDSGVCILASVDILTANKNISASSNAIFYLERTIHRYLIIDHPSLLKKAEYDACLFVLNLLVENSSAIAYQVREMLLKTKRISS